MSRDGKEERVQPAPARDRYRRLPDPIALEDTVSTKDADPVQDPDAGRDPERDFMLRYSG